MMRRMLVATALVAALLGGAGVFAAGTGIAPAVAETATPTPTPTPEPSGSSTPGPTSSATPSPTPAPVVNSDGGPVPAAQPEADAPELRVTSELVVLGEWISARSRDNKPGEKVQFVLYRGGIIIGSFVADENGTAIAEFQLPPETRPGVHVLEATGWESENVANIELTVVAPATTTAPGLEWMIFVGVALVLSLLALGFGFRDVIRRAFTGEAGSEEKA